MAEVPFLFLLLGPFFYLSAVAKCNKGMPFVCVTFHTHKKKTIKTSSFGLIKFRVIYAFKSLYFFLHLEFILFIFIFKNLVLLLFEFKNLDLIVNIIKNFLLNSLFKKKIIHFMNETIHSREKKKQ